MIWHESRDGTHESGHYKIHRMIRGFDCWYSSPNIMRLLGHADSLRDAKLECVTHDRRAKEAIMADLK